MSCQGRRTKGLSRISVYGLAPPCLFWAANKLLLTLLNASKSSCALLLRGSNPTPAVLLFFFSRLFLGTTCMHGLASPRRPPDSTCATPPCRGKTEPRPGRAAAGVASARRKSEAYFAPPAGPWHDKNAAKWGPKTERGAHFRCIEIRRN